MSEYNYKLFVVLFSLMFLVSCATTPVSNEEAREVEMRHVIDAGVVTPRQGFGEVVVKRDQGLNTSACRSRVFVDGEPVADIASGEKVTMYLPVGEVMLAAKATGICAGGLVEVSARVSDSKTSTFRVSYGTWGEFSIQPTSF